MSATLTMTALAMGLSGGAHCLGMCAAPCAALFTKLDTDSPKSDKGRWFLKQVTDEASMRKSTTQSPPVNPWLKLGTFHAGRLVGYTVAGALVAAVVQSLESFSGHTRLLRPLWSLMHALVLIWGVYLLINARQPQWTQGGGQSFWARMVRRTQPLLRQRGILLLAGALWALMPCGLLYSALLVAALTGDAWQGAACMALFALGTSASWLSGVWFWQKGSHWVRYVRWGSGATISRLQMESLGMRLTGLVLLVVSAWAVWHDVSKPFLAWCGLA